MDMDKIRQIALHLMGERKVHLQREKGGAFHHGQRTAQIALALRRRLGEDGGQDEVLTAAAWLHDCGKGIEPHAHYGALIAREALRGVVSRREGEQIESLIVLHADRRPQDGDFDAPVRILQDADLLDHFGVYEIWMNIQYWAHTEGSLSDMMEYYQRYHPDHVARNRRELNYDESLRIFDEKIAYEDEFIRRLEVEGAGGVCLVE